MWRSKRYRLVKRYEASQMKFQPKKWNSKHQTVGKLHKYENCSIICCVVNAGGGNESKKLEMRAFRMLKSFWNIASGIIWQSIEFCSVLCGIGAWTSGIRFSTPLAGCSSRGKKAEKTWQRRSQKRNLGGLDGNRHKAPEIKGYGRNAPQHFKVAWLPQIGRIRFRTHIAAECSTQTEAGGSTMAKPIMERGMNKSRVPWGRDEGRMGKKDRSSIARRWVVSCGFCSLGNKKKNPRLWLFFSLQNHRIFSCFHLFPGSATQFKYAHF